MAESKYKKRVESTPEEPVRVVLTAGSIASVTIEEFDDSSLVKFDLDEDDSQPLCFTLHPHAEIRVIGQNPDGSMRYAIVFDPVKQHLWLDAMDRQN